MILNETVISSLVPEHTAILELIPCFSDEWGRKRKNGVSLCSRDKTTGA